VRNDLLNVVAVYANPIRWESRKRLHREFEQHMLDSGVSLTTVECQHGDRPYDLDDHPHINRVRVRASSVCWQKESLLNCGISRLPDSAKYIAWIDADISFRKPNWASETVHRLQQYPIVQPWDTCYDLGPNGEHLELHKSFCAQYWRRKPLWCDGPYEFWHPGYAWACTRQTLEWLGGLLDIGITGANDHHMALALIGKAHLSLPGGVHPNYRRHVMNWQERAVRHINQHVGFIEASSIEHHFHGAKKDRKYIDRWQIVTGNNYDPDHDIKRNTHGVIELCGNKARLTHDLDIYMRQRNEDANTY